jgi:hypothetical protein
VPANGLAARSKLNLVSPVRGVEGVVAADRAAGGAPPDSRARILRFGSARLRHRARVVTLRDLEDLALQSSPDIAQARGFASFDGVRLVVAMRGPEPRPTAAQRRELRRLLQQFAPVSLAAPDALRLETPVLRRLRVSLSLRVASLDLAGAVVEAARSRVSAAFDAATGGDGIGWQLGRNPDEGDLAFALRDIEGIEGIESVALSEIVGEDAAEQPWPALLGSADLVVLDGDAFRFDFESSGELP